MQRHRQRFSETDKITVVFGTKRNLPRFAISLLCFICYIFFHQQVIVWMYEWRNKPLWSAIRGGFCGTFCSLHFPSTVSKQSSEGQDLEMESDSKPPIAPGCRHMSEKYRKHHKHMGKHISHTNVIWLLSVQTEELTVAILSSNHVWLSITNSSIPNILFSLSKHLSQEE